MLALVSDRQCRQFLHSSRRHLEDLAQISVSQPSPSFSRPALPPQVQASVHPLASVETPPLPPGLARRHTSADIREHGWPLPPNQNGSPYEGPPPKSQWKCFVANTITTRGRHAHSRSTCQVRDQRRTSPNSDSDLTSRTTIRLRCRERIMVCCPEISTILLRASFSSSNTQKQYGQ